MTNLSEGDIRQRARRSSLKLASLELENRRQFRALGPQARSALRESMAAINNYVEAERRKNDVFEKLMAYPGVNEFMNGFLELNEETDRFLSSPVNSTPA